MGKTIVFVFSWNICLNSFLILITFYEVENISQCKKDLKYKTLKVVKQIQDKC